MCVWTLAWEVCAPSRGTVPSGAHAHLVIENADPLGWTRKIRTSYDGSVIGLQDDSRRVRGSRARRDLEMGFVKTYVWA